MLLKKKTSKKIKMKKIFIFLISLFLLLFFLKSVEGKILINEFLIEPTPQQVEIINIGTESANLYGWIIDDDGGSSATFTIPDNSIIYPNSCLIFSGNFYLNAKTADTIRLFDNQNILVDSFSYKLSPGQGVSYQRIPDGEDSWKTQSSSLGFFNSSLQSCVITPTPTPTPTLTQIITETPILNCTGQACVSPTNFPTQNSSPTNTPIPTPISYQNIYLSEVYPNPQTGENEWVEIYNDNDFIVNLNNWYIDDIEDGGSSPKKFSLTIQPKSYAAFDLSTAMFNNDGDFVRLLDFEKKEKDSFEYKNSQKGKSFGRISLETDDFCLQEPSKNQKNNLCLNPTPTQEVTPTVALISSHLSSIATSPTKTMLPFIKKSNQNPFHYQSVSNIKTAEQNNSALITKKTDVLGVYNKRKTNRYSFFSFLSLSYSVLSAFGIIIKTVKHFS